MALTTKQKSFIKKNHPSLSAEKIATQINADINDVAEFIKSIKTEKKYPLYFYLILLAIPIFLVSSIEGILRIIDYGEDIPIVQEVGTNLYVINPDIGKRYFTNVSNPPSPSNDFFKKVKSENAFRVFVLGGSSAAGFPYSPSASFAKYIRKALNFAYPDKEIEVINTSMSAVNSYTLLDISKEIIKYSPDLICIYAGHNEYYGALGVASTESMGNSRFLIKLYLTLQDAKIVKMMGDLIKYTLALFSSETKDKGTLMARMTKEKSIEYNSSLFYNGIEQFEGNLADIIEIFKEKNIPIIISSLASNLKDQKPFVSINNSELGSAESNFNKGNDLLKKGSITKADSLFRLAKDLDGLRFRAPEHINSAIKKLAEEYDLIYLDSESLLSSYSPYNIIGDELMTDHLHPNLFGYQLIGKGFFEKIVKNNLIDSESKVDLNIIDSLTIKNFDMTKLDSTVAEYRLIILKTDWPFVEKQMSKEAVLSYMNPQNFIDSLALKIVDNKLNLLQAHQEAAKYYIMKGDLNKFNKEINYLIDFLPVTYENYDFAAELLLAYKYYDEALDILLTRYKKKPNAFSTKWLGIIYLNRDQNKEALRYLKESLSINPLDAQLLYNLSGVYIKLKDYQTAKMYIDRCINLDANFPNARQIQYQLNRIVN